MSNSILLALAFLTLALPVFSTCPCAKSDQCLPITDTTRKEVYAFSLKNDLSRWLMYDWSKVTTVVMVGYFNTTLMCLAHSYNTRVSYIANSGKVNFTDSSSRQSWIVEQLKTVEEYYLDGLNFDFEGVIAQDDEAMRKGYTSLVAETKLTINKKFPYFHVTVDVPWKQNVDSRYFDFKGLAAASDFLFVMAYDEQSQIFGECVAGPNADFFRTYRGIEDYLSLGIGPDKLVLGLPWYGYIYPCISQEKDKCFLKHVPFRGVNCSDAAGKQYNYGYIYSWLKQHGATGIWNSTSLTPYYTFKDSDNVYHQIQYDNPMSLSRKYDHTAAYNLRGVGFWNIDELDYTDTPDGKYVRDSMFGPLPNYKSTSK